MNLGASIAFACLVSMLALAGLPARAVAGDPPPAKQVAPVETLLVLNVDGDVDIEPDGSVSAFHLQSKAPGKVPELLEQAARKWRFAPVLQDGVPAKVTARTRVTLGATEKGGAYEIWLDNVLFPGEARPRGVPPAEKDKSRFENERAQVLVRSQKPPGYPIGLMRAGIGARVLVGLRIGEDGAVADVVLLQSQLFDASGSDRNLARAIEVFENAALAGARTWRFEVTRKGAGPIPADKLTALTTIEFVPFDRKPAAKDGKDLDLPGQWRWITRLPKRRMPWLPATQGPAYGVSDMVAGEVFPLQSNLRLLDPVDRTAL